MTPSVIEHATFQLVAQYRTCLVIMHYFVVLIKYGQRDGQRDATRTFACNLCTALITFWVCAGSQDIHTER